jgi:cobalamin synthase
VAFAVPLAVADGVGLLVVVSAALVTVGVRVGVHRRLGGLTGGDVAATRELVEALVVGVLALLAQLKT